MSLVSFSIENVEKYGLHCTHVQYRRTDTVCQIDHTICMVCQTEKVVVDPLTVR